MPRSAGAIFVYSCLSLLAFTACVDNEPIIDEARVSVVFDYSAEAVEARLSVFANVKSDLDLADEVHLVNDEADLEWSCRELTKFTDASKNDWVGYAAFVAPEGEAIAKGKYVLTYEDSCEREGELIFTVDYPDALLERIIDESQSEPPQEGEEGNSEGALDGDGTALLDSLSDGDGEATADEAQDGTEAEVLSEAEQSAALQADQQTTTQELTSQEDSASDSLAEQAAQIAQDAPSQATQQDDALAEAQSIQVDTHGDESKIDAQGDVDETQGEDEGEGRQLEVRRGRRDAFKHKTADEVRAILGDGVQAKIALYSDEHELLYFGELEDDTLSHYKDAVFAKACLCTQDDAVICVFAEESVVR